MGLELVMPSLPAKSEEQCPPDAGHRFLAEGCDHGAQFVSTDGLDVIEADGAWLGHAVTCRQHDFGRDIADGPCDRSHGRFQQILQCGFASESQPSNSPRLTGRFA